MKRATSAPLLGSAAFLAVLAVGTIAVEAGSVTRDDTDLMAGPGDNYGRIGEIPGGAAIRVYSCGGDWCQVAYRGARGYIDADDIASGGGLRTLPTRDAPGLSGISDGLSKRN